MQLSQGHDRQSLCPKGLTRWDRLCAARVFRGDGHERGQVRCLPAGVNIIFTCHRGS